MSLLFHICELVVDNSKRIYNHHTRWKYGSPYILIWGLQFGVGEIIWGLKSRGPKCTICGLKFRVGEIIWGSIFQVYHGPSHFLGIHFFSQLDS